MAALAHPERPPPHLEHGSGMESHASHAMLPPPVARIVPGAESPAPSDGDAPLLRLVQRLVADDTRSAYELHDALLADLYKVQDTHDSVRLLELLDDAATAVPFATFVSNLVRDKCFVSVNVSVVAADPPAGAAAAPPHSHRNLGSGTVRDHPKQVRPQDRMDSAMNRTTTNRNGPTKQPGSKQPIGAAPIGSKPPKRIATTLVAAEPAPSTRPPTPTAPTPRSLTTTPVSQPAPPLLAPPPQFLNTAGPASPPRALSFTSLLSLSPSRISIQFPAAITDQLERFAAIFAAVIRSCILQDTTGELLVLGRLCCLRPEMPKESTLPPAFPSVLEQPGHGLYFAAYVTLFLVPLLVNISPQLVQHVSEHPAIRTIAGAAVTQLEELLPKFANLEHLALEAVADADDARASTVQPFDPASDSRHHFKDAKSVYQNRENTRDAFMDHLRQYEQLLQQHVDTTPLRSMEDGLADFARATVNEIEDVNIAWFANFLVQQYLRHCGNAQQESDDRILRLAKDSRKIQLLLQRVTQRDEAAIFESGVHGTTPDHPYQLFPGIQRFFYLFIVHTDSYRLIAQIIQITASHLVWDSSAAAKPSKSRDMRHFLRRSRLLGKLLGWLLFLPHITLSNHPGFDKTPALQKAALVAQQHADDLHIPLDMYHLLETAREDDRLVQVVPWMCEIMMFRAFDCVLSRTHYFSKLLNVLRQVYQYVVCRGHDESHPRSATVIVLMLESLFLVLRLPLTQASRPEELFAGDVRPSTDEDVTFPAMCVCVPHLLTLRKLFLDGSTMAAKAPGIGSGEQPVVATRREKIQPQIVEESSTGDESGRFAPAAGKPEAITAQDVRRFASRQYCQDHPQLLAVIDAVRDHALQYAVAHLLNDCVEQSIRDALMQGDNPMQRAIDMATRRAITVTQHHIDVTLAATIRSLFSAHGSGSVSEQIAKDAAATHTHGHAEIAVKSHIAGVVRTKFALLGSGKGPSHAEPVATGAAPHVEPLATSVPPTARGCMVHSQAADATCFACVLASTPS